MYRIIKLSDNSATTTESVRFIKMGDYKRFVSVSREDAVGVAVGGKTYNLYGHNEIPDADTVAVMEIDGGTDIDKQRGILDTLLLSALEG